MNKKHVILDATMMSSLMSCSRYLDNRFNRLLVPVAGKSNSLEAGSLAHTILEFRNKALIKGHLRNDAIDIGFAAGREYIAGYAPNNKYILDKEQGPITLPADNIKMNDNSYEIGYEWVVKTMEEYFDFWQHEDSMKRVIAAEEVRGKIIYEDDEIVILWKAKFDEISDIPGATGVPTDYKTSKVTRHPISLNNQFMGQSILTGSRNVIVDQIGFQTSYKPEKKFFRKVVSFTADRQAEWVNDIVPHYARLYVAYLEAGVWPPNYTHCENKYGKCMYIGACETDRGMREEFLKINFKKGKHWDIAND